ncbi:PLP-dependent aminotransferase family protein [Flexilinea flocculi]|jgi:hypothetical protein|uniref:dTDP-4-amino-4,6-dideoxygalactose transaminase n=1 Tax=Flexilinea flocculi TaxID=1678840 RepID=A0A0S7BQX9_9CHLR|nr:hypothetical protein [Flexilinea flocculi]GAP40194.1 hypothetical protein ATC1_13160 [Flexilinea flocculi]
MVIGGEFFYDDRWNTTNRSVLPKDMLFLNGGKACLIVISRFLINHGINRVLLPSYLCPTIVSTLERCGLHCDYYQVLPDFSIDLEDLDRKAIHHQVVYFINYFGFFHSEYEQTFLKNLQHHGKLLIEDNAQAGFNPHQFGDFVFNSIRKLAPYDGGYLSTTTDLMMHRDQQDNSFNHRLPVIRRYRKLMADYVFRGWGRYEELVDLYNLAETFYETDWIIEGNSQERFYIEQLDWKQIKTKRQENYSYLLEQISGICELKPIFTSLQTDNMPLGLPVYVSGISRDWLFDQLGKNGIGLTIHWNGLLSDPRLNQNAIATNMARTILTLVIDQRLNRTQLDYLAYNLVYLCKSGKRVSSEN